MPVAPTPRRSLWRIGAALATVATVAAACGDGGSVVDSDSAATPDGGELDISADCVTDPGLEPITVGPAGAAAIEPGTTLTLVAYQSFVVSDDAFDAFEAATGFEVRIVTQADTGSMVSSAILTAGNPIADVMWGIDNTSLCRALEADVFTPYASADAATVDASLPTDQYHRVTPVAFGDQCVNYWADALPVAPTSIDDLTAPEYASTFVTENPETSSPGMGFLLATIARYGDGEAWEQYWRDLAENGLAVTSSWDDAYFVEFIAGGGDRAIVMSYGSSPVAEVIYATEPLEVTPTAIIADTCFRSVEYAGVLAGSDHPTAAALLVDYLLSESFQADLPFNNFLYPANTSVEVPPEFVEFGPLVDDPVVMAPEVIQSGRDEWTQRWTEIVG